MDEKTQFLNVYVQVLRNKLDKSLSDLCNAETQLAITNDRVKTLSEESASKDKEIEKLKKEVEGLKSPSKTKKS